MSQNGVEDFLAHYGVLGMHWGRHLPGRTEKSHNPRPQKRREPSPEHAEAHSLNKQPISTLSTAELRKVNERLQAEKKYKELNPSTVKKGHNAVKSIIAVGGTITAVAALSKTPAGQAAVKAGSKFVSKLLAGNGRHAVGYVAPVVKQAAKHL